MKKGKISLKVSLNDETRADSVAYLSLPDYPEKTFRAAVAKIVRVSGLMENCHEADLYLDFDKDGVLFGVDVLP